MQNTVHELHDLPPVIDREKIAQFLKGLSYPLYFLDFESFQPAVPLYDNSSPYEQIVFQYSLHYIPAPGGGLLHKEYLAMPGEDPRRGVAEALCRDIPKDVCTLAYNMSFEKGRIRALAALYPDLSDHLMNIHNHIVDLMVPFQKRQYYCRAMQGSYKDWRIAVLNFASATTPGGGVTKGSSAQEESLCRCSTLYPALTSNALWDSYYSVNRAARNPLYTNALIYTPGVVICKTDEDYPERMEEKDWVEVDVITCAAPNLRQRPGNMYNLDQSAPVVVSPEELLALHKIRARHILTVAASKGVDAIVLGAFGCGAFQNDPTVVAKAYKGVLEEMKGYFSLIEFAIYCRQRETANYDAFSRVLA